MARPIPFLSGIERAFERVRPPAAGVTVLAYHRIGEGLGSNVDIPQRDFERQLDTLAEEFTVVSLDDACALYLSGAKAIDSTRPPVVLTFDDGTPDWAEHALPALVERRLCATFYTATAFVDEQRTWPGGLAPISWAGLAEMAGSGAASIGSHTHTHRLLHRVTASEARHELDRSRELIGEHLGVECTHFAYPKALRGAGSVEWEVRRAFRSAAVAGNRPNRPGTADLHRLGRSPVTRSDDIETFRWKAAGGARIEGVVRAARDRWRHRNATT